MHEFLAVLLECGDCVETKLIVLRDKGSGARDDHGTDGFVAAGEFFGGGVGNGDEVGFEVVGCLDDELGGNDGDERFGGEIAGLLALEGLEVDF